MWWEWNSVYFGIVPGVNCNLCLLLCGQQWVWEWFASVLARVSLGCLQYKCSDRGWKGGSGWVWQYAVMWSGWDRKSKVVSVIQSGWLHGGLTIPWADLYQPPEGKHKHSIAKFNLHWQEERQEYDTQLWITKSRIKRPHPLLSLSELPADSL